MDIEKTSQIAQQSMVHLARGIRTLCQEEDTGLVRKAIVDGRIVWAGPDSPKVATCPACGSVVEKRKRRVMSGQAIYFYRHKAGVGKGCPLRYQPG